jgi:homoserine kinase
VRILSLKQGGIGRIQRPCSYFTKMTLNSVTVRAPATSANLGPGFDCIGMALDTWNELKLTRGSFSVSAVGEGADLVPLDESNLVVTSVGAVFKYIGEPVPGLQYECTNRIPFSRGMGSSSAAIVAGLVAGSAISGADLSREELTVLAADIEGHPDNVAPAIYGGCTIGVRNGEAGWVVDRVSVPDDLHAVLFVPEKQTDTHESRGGLPVQISRDDAVFNIGRAALLVNALSTGRLEFLKHATEDRLHQPQRTQAFRPMPHLIAAALNGGAHGAFLSGAGPSVLALATGREVTIGYEMAETARHFGVDGKTMIMAVTQDGASVMSSVISGENEA